MYTRYCGLCSNRTRHGQLIGNGALAGSSIWRIFFNDRVAHSTFMMHLSNHRVLAINTGSSSLKALYEMAEKESLVLSLDLSRIGLSGNRMRITDAQLAGCDAEFMRPVDAL